MHDQQTRITNPGTGPRKAYQTSTHFVMSITILQMKNYHLVQKLRLVSRLKHLIM